MADPKDNSGTAGEPKTPTPAVPAIPRLTSAIPEKVDPAQSAPRAPVAGAGRPSAGTGPPHLSPVPQVAPLVPAIAPASPAAGAKVPSAPVGIPRQTTSSFPAVPAIAPVASAPRTAGLPKSPPVLPPAGALGAGAGRAPALDTRAEERAELERRFALLDQLDYFEVMGLAPTAAPADIKHAFHHQSRTFHPDRYFQSADVELREQVHAVYKRVTEAYFVLRDDARRKQYLADIAGPERLQKLRFNELAEAEAKAAVKKEVAEQIGTHPKGRQFFQVGLADLEAGRIAAAERNIKLALTYEPTNPLYLQKLEEARAKAYEEYKRSGRGFRIE
jgi:DnaJ domain